MSNAKMARVNLLLALASSLALKGATASSQNDEVVLGPQQQSKDDLHQVQKILEKAGIIPTVIDSFTPSLLIEVEWSSHNNASLGNTLKPKKLQKAPSVSLHQPESSSSGPCSLFANITYTVTITDPDAPSRDDPKWSEVCHWIATTTVPPDDDNTGSSSSSCLSHIDLSSSLQDVMPYKAPGPPEKTGKHRYVFFVFVPANGTTDPLDLTKPEKRQHWGYELDGERAGVKKWALENGLAPIAANFIYAQNKIQ